MGRAYQAIATGLAGMSYTLYAVHLPILVFLQAWLIPSTRWQPDAPHLLLLLSVTVVVFVLDVKTTLIWLPLVST